MAISDRFSQEEWEALAALPRLVATAASYADGHRFLEGLLELRAGAEALAQATSRYRDSSLVQEIAGERGVEIGDRPDPSAVVVENLDSIQEAIALTLTQANRVRPILDRIEPEIATPYREWLVDIAEDVADAVKRGSVLGVGGVRVTAEESEFLVGLRTALGMAVLEAADTPATAGNLPDGQSGR
jgi:hypothetical protein